MAPDALSGPRGRLPLSAGLVDLLLRRRGADGNNNTAPSVVSTQGLVLRGLPIVSIVVAFWGN